MNCRRPRIMPTQRDNDEERNERIDLFLRGRRASVEPAIDRTAATRKRMASATPRGRRDRRPDESLPDPARRR